MLKFWPGELYEFLAGTSERKGGAGEGAKRSRVVDRDGEVREGKNMKDMLCIRERGSVRQNGIFLLAR